ncbi:C4-dicarboxylate ABC transporter [Halarchaeum grantii]|uniref:C4-dicarboxylate ABC transporter n=1 Tax=Halarchaeum grantii TaxID=1193105 RepID=A0A830F2S5_9EURY|nr:DUF1850 domain-containing protein [Halarchaeum grantii]GGL34937.1 C4-dicarboxylate ABC transporter [Halarchaeum grantii]
MSALDRLTGGSRERSTRRVALAFLFALLLVSATATASAVPVGEQLVVTDQQTGDELIVTPVHENSTVALVYMHSVQKSRVLDQYAVRGHTLVYTRMEFESYGWGLPSRSAVREVNGTFVLEDPDWQGRELNVKPGRVADHELVVDGRTYDLVNRSDARAVTIRVTDRSLLEAALDTTTNE